MATITAIQRKIAEMSPAAFQRLCDDYLAKMGYTGIVSLGTMDGAEKTTPGTPDTYFCIKDGKYVFAEYTTQRDGLANKIMEDLEKCVDESETGIPVGDISEIIYCHTSSNLAPKDDHRLKQFCEGHHIQLKLFGIDQVSYDICAVYRTMAREHLNLEIDTGQIQTAEDFIRQHDSDKLAAPLRTSFIAREEEIKRLEVACTENDVVIVTGPAGIGKTRLSLEFALKHAKENDERVFCIHSRSLPLFDDLQFYFEQPGKYFVVVDDANQISNINHVIDLVRYPRDGFSFKLLVTVRDYAIEKVKESLRGATKYKEIRIEKFKDDVIKKLIREEFEIIDDSYLSRITAIAEGNARLAMMAGKVAKKENRLSSINDASELLSEYYGPIISDTGLNTDKELTVTAGVAAFLGTFHLERMDPVWPVLSAEGVGKDAFFSGLIKLSELEVVEIYYDKAVRFSEQSFANYILKFVFCDKKAISLSRMIKAGFFHFRNRTMFAISSLMNVFRSEEVHEYVNSEINVIWNELKESDPKQFWAFMMSFYPVKPAETLSLLKSTIEESLCIIVPISELNTEKENHQSATDEIISVLCGFADTEYYEAALDLFFQYYLKRPDLYDQFFLAATSEFGVKPSSFDRGFTTQSIFFTKLLEYADNWNNELILIFFLDVAKEFLKLEYSPCESTRDGKGAIMYQISLIPCDGVTAYRSLIWSALKEIAKIGFQPDRLRSVIDSYGNSFSMRSSEVIRKEASLVADVVSAGLNPEDLDDCLIVKNVASLMERCGIYPDEFQCFLHSAPMEIYQTLEGPKITPGYHFENRFAEHEDGIKRLFDSADSRIDMFIQCFDIYHSVKTPKYHASVGLNLALYCLHDHPEEYCKAVQYSLSSGTSSGIDSLTATSRLFAFLTAEEVYSLIDRSVGGGAERNSWMYAYYHELPKESVDEVQLAGLYQFLQDKSDAEFQKMQSRDIFFLEKYRSCDPEVFPNASRIILEKQMYSQVVVSSYFTGLFNPYEQNPLDALEVFQGHIELLEDIYFFLLHHNANEDLEGDALMKIAETDPNFAQRLAYELLQEGRYWSLGEEIGERCSALYDLENYVDMLDGVVNEAIRIADYSFRVPPVIEAFITFPEKRKDRIEKRDAWLQHYVSDYAGERANMECLFEALLKESLGLRKSCITWFLEKNDNYDDFKSLPLLPSSFDAYGSFSPVYRGWIEFLESLLPIFQGIRFIEHKASILKRIKGIRKMIEDEEISNIIRG